MNSHQPIARRARFMLIACITLAGMVIAPTLVAQEINRPNVLLISVDDLNDWIGAMGGHPKAITPNMDRLMARGVSFANAHCAAPVCAASRHALMSGLRPSTTGWYSNSGISKTYRQTLGATVPLPAHFQASGYRTMAAGKIFHKGVNDVSSYPMWDETRPKHKWSERLAARGHGYSGDKGGHFYPFPADGGAVWQKYRKDISGQSLCWGALEKDDIPAEGMPDEQVAAWAVERLGKDYDRPFLMAVGFVRPHVPLTAPKAFFDLYKDVDVKAPVVPEGEMSDIPLMGKALAYGTLPEGDHGFVLATSPDYWREMTVAYLACVSFVDAQLGKMLDALDNGPHA
ncbi:MAG: sulfatase-like hydrolase/transferase, partial [Planctomycetota bacterium]